MSYALRAAKTKSLTTGLPEGPRSTGFSWCLPRTSFKGNPTWSRNSPPSSRCHHVSACLALTRVAMSHGTRNSPSDPLKSVGSGQSRNSGNLGMFGSPSSERWNICRFRGGSPLRTSSNELTTRSSSSSMRMLPGRPQPATNAIFGLGNVFRSGLSIKYSRQSSPTELHALWPNLEGVRTGVPSNTCWLRSASSVANGAI
mmetsp:Transcript_4098/g.9707  ORF Transcript_4098/g.9707 Transcript_4098/m.9707 type:complete len:200 (-) Transcript_4098:144-743(-)